MVELTTDVVRELLDYNQLTGVFTWKVRAREWFKSEKSFKRFNDNYAGKGVGTVLKKETGYPVIVIQLLNKNYRAHRLAFIWMGLGLPEHVDHKDRDSTNNSWTNLVASTVKGNAKNKSMQRNNTSGVTGVAWSKAEGKWQASVRVSGKQKHLGFFPPEELHLAAQAVKEFKLENGFSDEHGMAHAQYMTG